MQDLDDVISGGRVSGSVARSIADGGSRSRMIGSSMHRVGAFGSSRQVINSFNLHVGISRCGWRVIYSGVLHVGISTSGRPRWVVSSGIHRIGAAVSAGRVGGSDICSMVRINIGGAVRRGGSFGKGSCSLIGKAMAFLAMAA